MNVTSTSDSSALWSLLAAQRSNATSATTTSSDDSYAQAASSASGDMPPPPPGPPPMPASFDTSMSTEQFAANGAGRAPIDFASLDSDGDGSVSSDEFGLDSADEMASELFSKIDEDGDGALSSDEISAFESMMAQHLGAGSPPQGSTISATA